MSAQRMSILEMLRHRRTRKPAQAMVEFALALPILLLVVYGLIESGRLVFMYASVVSAARQAVRYGSVTGENGSGVRFYNDCSGIRNAAKRMGFLQPIQDSDILISYDSGPGTAVLSSACPLTVSGHPINGDRIRVDVSTDYTPIVPLVRFSPFTIASSGTRTLLVGVSIAVDVPGVILTPGGTGAMALFKDANPASFDHAGQVINYRYTVTNLGGAPITGISITDDKVSGQGGSVNCSAVPDPLLSGGSGTCTAAYTVTSADVLAGALTNSAVATGTSDGIPLLAQANLTINFIPRPEITLVKLGTPPSRMSPNELAFYTFTLTNTGNVKLNGPFSVTDPLVDVVTCSNQADIPVGGSTTCTGDYPITQQDLNNRQVVNSATATGYYGTFKVTSNIATYTLLLPELVLTMSATPPNITTLGQTITYTYTLHNRTNKAMSNAAVDDSRVGAGFTCPAFASIGAGATVSCSRNYAAYTQTDMNGGYIINNATGRADATSPPRTVTTNPSSLSIPVIQTKQLTLTKTADRAQATNVGDVITYSYEIKNTGNVTINAPFGVTDNKIPVVNCTGMPASLAPLAKAPCANATYTVTSDDVNLSGVVVNKARATGKFLAETVTSAEVSTTVITYPNPRLGIKKSAAPAFFSATGQTLVYTFTLLNTGGVPLNGPFTVSDAKLSGGVANCSGAASSIPVAGSTTCTGSYVVTAADSLLERVDNLATATGYYGGTPLNGTPISNFAPSPATLTVPKFVCNNARVKHTDPTPIPGGSTAQWTIVNNSGIALTIQSITINWATNPPTLNQVQLPVGTTVFSGTSFANGGFIVPGGPWNLPTGNTIMQLNFGAATTAIQIRLNVTGPGGCNLSVDSNFVYPS